MKKEIIIISILVVIILIIGSTLVFCKSITDKLENNSKPINKKMISIEITMEETENKVIKDNIPQDEIQFQNDLYAYIDFNEDIVKEINLTKAEDEEFEIIALNDHVVKFQIEDHKIRFLESECPEKICVHTGWLSRENDIAACLPNRVTLYITSKK